MKRLRRVYIKALYKLANMLITWGYALEDRAILMELPNLKFKEYGDASKDTTDS